jgi:hypothetical protein
MLLHGLKFAKFQCPFLSTIYISKVSIFQRFPYFKGFHISTVSIFQQFPYFNSFHISTVSIFQQFQYFNVPIFQLPFFNYLRGKLTARYCTVYSMLFVCPARAITTLCLRVSAFPIVSCVYHIKTQKGNISPIHIKKKLYNCAVYTNSINIKPLQYGCFVFKMVETLVIEIVKKVECRVTGPQ